MRGFRIEPGEIEHRLLEHPGVSAAAVLATASAGPGSDVQLVAHVVAPPELSVADLRAHLAERLPEHMVPARFVRLAALPLTATGKTDREVLALLPGAELRLGPVFEPPRDEREEALAASWREVLQRDPVGIHDSYFALGGDSIQAIQVAARLEARGLRLRIQDLFQHPTIATLAPHLTPVEKPAPGAEPTPGDVPLTPIQRWFFAMFAGTPPVEAASPLAFAHALVLRFARRYPREVVEGALQRVVSRHPALAFTFVRHDGGWVQRPGADGAVDLKVLELPADVDPAEVLEERAAERLAQLDLARSPLAATLFFGADADRLLLLVHHLVIDGVSWRVLLEDFGLALGGLSRGEEVELAPEVTSFARWAAEQAGAPPVEPSEARYWRALEAAIRPLSVDDPAGANRFRDGAEEVLRLSTELTAQLLGPANRAFGTSPEDLLLAGLAGALRGWPGGGPGRGTGGGPWVITLEGHGRVERAGELGRTIGWFTSRFPFALPLADEPVATRIKTVKEALRRVPAGGAGYGRLRYPRQGPADPPAPEPDLSFNYLGGVEAAAALAPFTLAPALGWRAGVNGELPRPSEIDLSVLARDGRLELRLGHSRERLRAATVAALGARWQRELAAIAEHCLPRRPEVTPADLSYAGISLEDLEGITS